MQFCIKEGVTGFITPQSRMSHNFLYALESGICTVFITAFYSVRQT